MPELNKGDLIISNDLMGFIIDIKQGTILLNANVGQKEVKYGSNVTVLATGQEIASRCASKLVKKVKK